MGPERVVARLTVAEIHLQPLGLVHGGVYAAVAESAASYGASVSARRGDPDRMAVGLENHTSFLRAARLGTVVAVEAVPLHAGRRTQNWSVVMTDSATGTELARSTVRLLVVGVAEF